MVKESIPIRLESTALTKDLPKPGATDEAPHHAEVNVRTTTVEASKSSGCRVYC